MLDFLVKYFKDASKKQLVKNLHIILTLLCVISAILPSEFHTLLSPLLSTFVGNISIDFAISILCISGWISLILLLYLGIFQKIDPPYFYSAERLFKSLSSIVLMFLLSIQILNNSAVLPFGLITILDFLLNAPLLQIIGITSNFFAVVAWVSSISSIFYEPKS